MIETLYAEMRDLTKRITFRASLKPELPDGENLITAGYILSIESEEDKEERYRANHVAVEIWIQ